MADRKEPPFYNDESMGAFQYKLPIYETMELFIETLTGTCFELRVSPFEAVISVKAKIQRLEGIPVAQQHLIWNNLELDDEYCLHDYGIAEGCTLKLILAMRGGPINTRRVTMENPVKEVADLMEGTREECIEKALANKQVTFLVYREDDQLNFFRVVDRGDGTLSPLSESLSGGSVYNVYTEEEVGESSTAAQQNLENSITMNKMKLLKAKMEDMNLNKKPKKSAKLKPRPPVSPHPCSSSLGPASARHHHRLFRVLPQINHPWHENAHLPPIRDCRTAAPSAADAPAHLSVTQKAPPSFSTSSGYMLQEEEPCETCPPFTKIRPPPKVSRLDVGRTQLIRNCVYPQLPPLPTMGHSECAYEAPEPVEEAVSLALLEEVPGRVQPTQTGALFGDPVSDPLNLTMSTQPEGDLQTLEVNGQLHLPPTSSPLSTWTLETADGLTSRADRPHLGSMLHVSPPSPLPPSTSPSPVNRQLPQPFEFTGSSLPPNTQAQPSTLSKTVNIFSNPPSTSLVAPSRQQYVKVGSPGKRPEMISKSEARGITKMANQAYKEPLGSFSNSELLASLSDSTADSRIREGLGQSLGLAQVLPIVSASGQGTLGPKPPSIPTSIQLLQEDLIRQMSPSRRVTASYMTSNSLGFAYGPSTSIRRLGTPTYHLPPVKAPTGSKKKTSKHCFLCDKKTGLATSYECRCGNNFCATHRYAETHDCTYDYKSTGRRFLQETNPIVSVPKLPKI
ncbi:AN1-type zinc finger protein 4 isoform X2 [Lampris incognitus]|uniref:AN1-type zinc finger protein 4 isoform X2 n=1 Tax=Lampris incognitus TaxID=2546036 RepID=UPI0024B5C8AB|nr:AN1-type zinc finger protein 4 isoform X2 [Lampris incognitus]